METRFTAQALKDGNVRIRFHETADLPSVDIPAMEIGKVVIALLIAAQKASDNVGFRFSDVPEDDLVVDVPGIIPDGIGTYHRDKLSLPSLVIYCGLARFALGVDEESLHGLVRTLQTSSAREGRKN